MPKEQHRMSRVGWLRAGVLGANDGLLSTASLVVGVAAAGSSHAAILVSGMAGLVGGAMSMAAGEYVSVSSQADTERADLAREQVELEEDEPGERVELAAIYVARGLTDALAEQVATQLMARDALAAHARDEHGMSHTTAARPLQAALTSAVSFAVGALPPVVVGVLAPRALTGRLVMSSALVLLAVLGAVAARVGGAPMGRGAARIVVWGAVAMGAAALVGFLFGVHVA